MPEPWALGDYHLRLTVVCFLFLFIPFPFFGFNVRKVPLLSALFHTHFINDIR
jgi:hypothetical protein